VGELDAGAWGGGAERVEGEGHGQHREGAWAGWMMVKRVVGEAEGVLA